MPNSFLTDVRMLSVVSMGSLLTPELDVLFHAEALDAIGGADFAEVLGGAIQVNVHLRQAVDDGHNLGILVRLLADVEPQTVGNDADIRLIRSGLLGGRLFHIGTRRSVLGIVLHDGLPPSFNVSRDRYRFLPSRLEP